jgi:hypothetical protein
VGHSAAHGQVIDRAAYGESADIAAGEEDGVDRVAVGGKGESAAYLKDGGIIQPVQYGVAQLWQEDLLN